MSSIVKKQTRIENPNGTRFLISTALIDGDFETMVFDDRMKNMEEHHATGQPAAFEVHQKFVEEYTEQVKQPVILTGKYLQFAEDLKVAAEFARHVDLDNDGGTSNFDALELTLSQWGESKVIAAAESAGLRAYQTKDFGVPVFVFSTPVSRQGNARTQQAETMRDKMKDLGYDSSVWYQMD
jgi:uncharacterized protein YcgL (UPF0745 family)